MFTLNKGVVCFPVELSDRAKYSIILVVLSVCKSYYFILNTFQRKTAMPKQPIPGSLFVSNLSRGPNVWKFNSITNQIDCRVCLQVINYKDQAKFQVKSHAESNKFKQRCCKFAQTVIPT